MTAPDAGRAPDDADWSTLLARQFTADFHAVITTGIVCRHGCPARTPLRKNVLIFGSLAPALNAGFRPCKRCKPKGATPESS